MTDSAIGTLVVRTVRGRLLRTLRLMRRPRYLFGTIAALVYIVWSAQRVLDFNERGIGFFTDRAPEGFTAGLHALAACALALGLTMPWIFRGGRTALGLSDADVQFLLPAPMPRHRVLRYALLKAQPGAMLGACVLGLVASRGGLHDRAAVVVAYWMLLTLIDLHAKGAALWAIRQRSLPREKARPRAIAVYALLAAYWGALAWAARPVVRAVTGALAAAGDGGFRPAQFLTAAGRALEDGFLTTLLTPFLWFTTAMRPEALGAALLPALGVIAAHYLVIVHSTVRFEDAALDQVRRRALRAVERRVAERPPPGGVERRRGPSTGPPLPWLARVLRRGGEPFRLSPSGHPAVAIAWKNVRAIMGWPVSTVAGLALAALALVTLGVVATGAPDWLVAAGAGAAVPSTFMLAIFGGNLFRIDLRVELRRLDVVRAWPVSGRALVIAEVVSSAALSTLCAAAALGLLLAVDGGARLAVTLGRSAPGAGVAPDVLGTLLYAPAWSVAWLAVLGALPLLAALAILSAALQNLVVLLVPGWLDARPARGFDPAAFGQRLLFFGGLAFALAIALIPSAVAVTAIVLGQRALGWRVTAFELPLFGAVAALPPLVLSYPLVALAARLWSGLDPAQDVFAEE